MNKKQEKRIRLKGKIRAQIKRSDRLRFSIFRSNSYIYGQIIDDKLSKTLIGVSDLKIDKGTKTERAIMVGKEIARLAKEKKITDVVFDRNGFKYTGRVKALADSAREGGLNF